MKHNSISIFNAALRGFPILRPHNMLNSTAVHAFIPRKGSNLPHSFKIANKPNFTGRKEKIIYTRPVTGAQFSIEFTYLDSIQVQDVLQCIIDFLRAIQLCG